MDCMMTAAEARGLAMDNGDDDGARLTAECMRRIRDAAKSGKREVCLGFVPADPLSDTVARRLRLQGFDVWAERRVLDGVLQNPCYYARW